MQRLFFALVAVAAGQVSMMPGEGEVNTSPVGRVVSMLTNMRDDAIAQQKQDKQLFENMDCWCKTNKEQKANANDAASKKIKQLQDQIEEFAAKIIEYEEAQKQATKDMNSAKDTLRAAEAQRNKQREEFEAAHQELADTMAQLDRAIEILGKVQGRDLAKPDQFLQVHQKTALRSAFRGIIRNQYFNDMENDLFDMLAAFPEAPRKKSMLQSQKAPGYANYNARSAQIFGRLTTMKEYMVKDNGHAMKTEAAAKAAFKKLAAAQQQIIKEAKEAKMEAFNVMTQAKIDKSNAESDLGLTQKALGADQEFLGDLEKKCTNWDSEYEERSKTRAEEIVAIGEALSVLVTDEARDTFMSAGHQFLQTRSRSTTRRMNRAVEYLRQRGLQSRKPELLQLANTVKLDGFEKVKKAMDEMVARLRKEQADEFVINKQCNEQLTENGNQQVDSNNIIEDLTDKSKMLSGEIERLDGELKDLAEQLNDLHVSVKGAGEDRADQNMAFQVEVNNQRATVALLQQSLDKLQAFYARKAVLMQDDENKAGKANKEAPENFETFKTSKNAGGVMVMIQGIIAEADRADAEAMSGEAHSQKAYAKFIRESNDAISENHQMTAQKQEEKAKNESELADTEADLRDQESVLEGLKKGEADLHGQCDFLMKNFDLRQQARSQEIDDINSAKAILSGANFGEDDK